MKLNESPTDINSSLPAASPSDTKYAKVNKNPPKGIYLSHRFLSPWTSNQLHLATGHYTEPKAKITKIDLDQIILQCSKKDISKGVYFGLNPLTKFPKLLSGLKLAINSCLLLHDKGHVTEKVNTTINRLHVFFSYLIQNGIYCLEDCSQEITQKLIDDLTERTPLEIMELDFHLLNLNRDLQINVHKARLLMEKKGNLQRLTLIYFPNISDFSLLQLIYQIGSNNPWG